MKTSTVFAIALLMGCMMMDLANGFYLPGVNQEEYEDDKPIQIQVSRLTSTRTQLPYDFYSLPFCKPAELDQVGENLGMVLSGDKIENSPYKVYVKRDETPCSVLCVQTYNDDQMKLWAERIKEEYRVHWILDNLPAATKLYYVDASDPDGNTITKYEDGFPLGVIGTDKTPGYEAGKMYLNNHLKIVISYHTDPSYKGSRIVGFEVEPMSIKHTWDTPENSETVPKTCSDHSNGVVHQEVDKAGQVIWTYEVLWRKSDVRWASRWDNYLKMMDDEIHWFSIINSFIIVLFLTGMIAMILARTLHRDLRAYNRLETSEEAQEETGWKLVHADVFRPPDYPMLFSVLNGTGLQLTAMTGVTIFFAVLGFLSPANRGGLMTAMLLIFVLMGILAGYSSSRLYKLFAGEAWKRNTLLTAFLFPGVVFFLFFWLDMAIIHTGSTGAVPFGTFFALLAMWFCISVPLVFLGSYMGYTKAAIELPVRTNRIPRRIPAQLWYMKPLFSCLMGGILPFGSVFIELYFIMSSLWLHRIYYIFGFLFAVCVILFITCAEIAIVMVYFQLCAEDYHWWWRSFLTSGSSALYMFIYSVFYFFDSLHIQGWVSALMYFAYSLIIAACFFLVTGSIGFHSVFFFNRKIYDAVKID